MASGEESTRQLEEGSLLAELARRLVPHGGEETWPELAVADGKYDLAETIGRGGMGVVHRAVDKALGRSVAIKLLRDENPRTVERFVREARAQARVVHEHVCRVYEVGTLDGHPFIAMQLVDGAPLGAVRAQMSLADKVRVLRDVAFAVHAAHRVGLIHRDLKPSNILVERIGTGPWRPCVVDFGIAREIGAGELTLTGQVLGTPQFMSPEQALGRASEIDRRTDVYALGATLYDVLTGTPPFTGTIASVLAQVVEAEPTPPRTLVPDLPFDLESIVLRCLRKEPHERYDSARALADDLDCYLAGEPVTARRTSVWYRIRKRARKNPAFTAAVAVGVLVTAGVGAGLRIAALRERDQRVRGLVEEGVRARTEAHDLEARERQLRERAFALFDVDLEREAEPLWRQALATREARVLVEARAGRAFEAALEVDPEREATRAALADNLVQRALLAERDRELGKRGDLIQRLELYDAEGLRRHRLEAESILSIETRPVGAEVSVAPYVDEAGRLREGAARSLGATPIADARLPRGSYVLTLTAPDRATVRYPLLLDRGESLDLALDLPEAAEIPEGFVYVPPGRFLVGTATEAGRRLRCALPLHVGHTPAYIIGRNEVTVAEWLAFLEALPPDQRARRSPAGSHPVDGEVAISEVAPGTWEYRFQPVGAPRPYVARTGELFRHGGRRQRAVQDWTRFPVTAVSAEDAQAYAAWLDRTRRVPGARLCTQLEWERAARGADDREYPTGAQAAPGEANVRDTYGGMESWGLDEVGSHPATRSPFGLDDVMGNAGEWCATPVAGARTYLIRSLHHYPAYQAIPAREPAAATLRMPRLGLRICAGLTSLEAHAGR